MLFILNAHVCTTHRLRSSHCCIYSLVLIFQSLTLWILLVYAQRYTLKGLLMYKGWMFDSREWVLLHLNMVYIAPHHTCTHTCMHTHAHTHTHIHKHTMYCTWLVFALYLIAYSYQDWLHQDQAVGAGSEVDFWSISSYVVQLSAFHSQTASSLFGWYLQEGS